MPSKLQFKKKKSAARRCLTLVDLRESGGGLYARRDQQLGLYVCLGKHISSFSFGTVKTLKNVKSLGFH